MIHISVSENIEGFRAIREAIDGNSTRNAYQESKI
jgi:hypothetical protein